MDKKTVKTMYISEQLYRKLKAYAAKKGLSMSAVLEAAIIQYISNKK